MVKQGSKPKKQIKSKPAENELDKDTLELEQGSSSSSEEESEGKQADEEFDGFSSTDEEEEAEEEQPKTSIHKVKLPTAQKNKTEKKTKKRGILYIGRLPQGFEEAEIEKYFKQFGNIVNVRVARNKKTGNSKHYGFLEFDSFEVAEIAQETMNNYLIFNHILKCQLIGEEEESEKIKELFKNSDKKFKKIPWVHIAKRKFENRTAKQYKELQAKHDNKKKQRMEKLKQAGISFDLVK